jgi:hypothetical protein
VGAEKSGASSDQHARFEMQWVLQEITSRV